MKRIVRVYVDTSVFGGVFDDEFAQASKDLEVIADEKEEDV